MDILMAIAKKSGLDPGALQEALQARRYLPRLEEVNREARKSGITGAPTFIINGRHSIVGAQPLEIFRETLKGIQTGQA